MSSNFQAVRRPDRPSASSRQSDFGNKRGDATRNGYSQVKQPLPQASRRKEPIVEKPIVERLNAAQKKKLQEEAEHEKRRQRLKDEDERIRLRDLALAGKRIGDVQKSTQKTITGKPSQHVSNPGPSSSSASTTRRDVEVERRLPTAAKRPPERIVGKDARNGLRPGQKAAGPDPESIRKFLDKKRREDMQREAEARAKKEQLLDSRRKDTKLNKAAKMMANRTKDNNFAKINLTETEVLAKRQIEERLKKSCVESKVERMKQRIDLEEKVPATANKRKAHRPEPNQEAGLRNRTQEEYLNRKREQAKLTQKSASSSKSNNSHRLHNPAPPTFNDLLKIASGAAISSPGREMSSRPDNSQSTSKKLLSQRPQPRMPSCSQVSTTTISSNSKTGVRPDRPSASSRPPDLGSKHSEAARNGYPQQSKPTPPSLPKKKEPKVEKPKVERLNAAQRKKLLEEAELEKRRQRLRDEEERIRLRNQALAGKRSGEDVQKFFQKANSGKPPQHAAKYGQSSSTASATRRNEEVERRLSAPAKKPHERINGSVNKEAIQRLQAKPKRGPLPLNPYLDNFESTSRKLLGERPQPRMPSNGRRPFENFDDSEDEDEEMNDFIDDGDDYRADHKEDISSYIREIFGYDKRKYIDMNDDDIQEATFGQVDEEEIRSAKIGAIEDWKDMQEEAEHKRKKALRLKKARIIESDSE